MEFVISGMSYNYVKAAITVALTYSKYATSVTLARYQTLLL